MKKHSHSRITFSHSLSSTRSLSLVFGLSLLACQASPPQTTPPQATPNKIQTALVLPEQFPQHTPQLSASADYDPSQQALTIHISANFKSNAAFQTQAIQCGEIAKVRVNLQGLGIAPNSFTQTITTTGTDCEKSGLGVLFSSVPIGKARVLEIQALDSSDNVIPHAEIRAAFDLGATAQTLTVNQESTPLADIISKLSQQGSKGQYLIGKLDLNAATAGSLGAFMQSAVIPAAIAGHPRLIDTDAIVSALMNNQGETPPSSTPFIQAFGSVNFTLSAPNGNYTVQISDPSSGNGGALVSANSGAYTANEVLPGTWQVRVYSTSPQTLVHTSSVTVSSGGSATVAVSVPFVAAPVSEWSMLNGPVGGNVYSLHDLGSNQWLAGTHAGLYRTSNLNNLDAGSPWNYQNGLEGKKVLALLKASDGTIYAGINAGELFLKTGTSQQGVYIYNVGNSSWEPDTDSNLSNLDVNDLIEGTALRIYGASSDGVVEKNGSTWSKVNGPGSVLAGQRITDIHYFAGNSTYYLASPDQAQVYQATSPASPSIGGWAAIGSLPGGVTPLSVSADNITVFTGTQAGLVYRFDGAWNEVRSGSSPGAAVNQLDNFLDNNAAPGPRLRLLAATNGFLNSGVSRAVQTITNTNPTTPFVSDSWAELGQNGQTVKNPFIHHFSKTGSFNPDSLAGLLIGTAGAGISQSIANPGNTVNPATTQADIDWLTRNTGLVASEIKDIAHFKDGTGDYYFVATKGYGVHRYHNGIWTDLINLPVAEGRERYPEALTIDGNGSLYASYADKIAILYDAKTAAPGTNWTALADPSGSGTLRDLTYASTSNRILAVESGGGRLNYMTACPAPPASCTPAWNTGLFGGTPLFDDFYSIGVSSINANLLYAGALEDIYKSTDGGSTWTSLNLTSSGLVSAGQAVNNLSMGQASGGDNYLYFTTSGGAPVGAPLYGYFNNGDANWLNLSGASGLPASSKPLAIAAQADDPTRLLVSLNQGGVYLSQNASSGASASFAAFDTNDALNPPVPSTAQITFSSLLLITDSTNNKMLLGGSDGRGLYRSTY